MTLDDGDQIVLTPPRQTRLPHDHADDSEKHHLVEGHRGPGLERCGARGGVDLRLVAQRVAGDPEQRTHWAQSALQEGQVPRRAHRGVLRPEPGRHGWVRTRVLLEEGLSPALAATRLRCTPTCSRADGPLRRRRARELSSRLLVLASSADRVARRWAAVDMDIRPSHAAPSRVSGLDARDRRTHERGGGTVRWPGPNHPLNSLRR